MSVIEETFALFTLITEFSTVRVSGPSCNGFKVLKFFGRSLESSMNSPLMISFTGLAGTSWTESIAVSAETAGKLNICGMAASAIAGVESALGGDISGLSLSGDAVTWVDDSEAWALQP